MPPYMPTDLLQRMQGGSTTPSYDPVTGAPTYMPPPPVGLPFIYSQAQQAGPTNTGNAYGNLALQVLAPIAAQMMGVQNPQFMPAAPPGVSPSTAYYMRDVQSPIFQAAQQQYLWQWGGALGGTMGAMTGNAQWQQNLVNAGQSDIGRMVTQMAMGTPLMQNVMGGDPMRMQEMLFASRGSLAGRQVVDPYNISAQIGMARQTNDFAMNLTQAMYQRPNGEMGITPNMGFTRGFSAQDIGGLAQQMAVRGAPGFVGLAETGGMDPTQARAIEGQRASGRTEQVRQMVSTMSSLSELMGGGSMTELIKALDRLTNMQWPTLNPSRMEQTFRRMSATAEVLGVSGTTMLATAESFQQGMNMSAGIGPGQAALGITAGGYAGLPVAQYLTDMTLSGAKARGVQADPVAVARMTAQQSALVGIGFNSPFGKDARMMGWLAETGQIDVGTFQGFIQSQSPEQAQSYANQTFNGVFGAGGAAKARRMMNDPAMAAVITQQTQNFAGPVVGGIVDMQGIEFSQRVQRTLLSTEAGYAQTIARAAGRSYNLPTAELAHTRLQGTLDYLTGQGARELGTDVRNVFDRAIATNQTPQQAMMQAQRFIDTSAALVPYRSGIQQAQRAMVMGEEINRVAFLSPELQADAVSRAKRGIWGVDPTLREDINSINSLGSRADMEDRKGNYAVAENLRKEMRQKQTDLEGKVTPEQRAAGQREGEAVSRNMGETRARAESARIMHERVRANAGGLESAVYDQSLVSWAFDARRRGASTEEVAGTLGPLATLSDTERSRVYAALDLEPNSPEFQKEEARQGAASSTLQRAVSDVEAKHGYSGIAEVVTNNMNARQVKALTANRVARLTQDKSLSDMMRSDLRRNLLQRVAEAGAGDAPVTDIVGLEAGGQVLSQRRDAALADERYWDAMRTVGGDKDLSFITKAKLSKADLETLGVTSTDEAAVLRASEVTGAKQRKLLTKAALEVADKESKERGESGTGGPGGKWFGTLILRNRNGTPAGTIENINETR